MSFYDVSRASRGDTNNSWVQRARLQREEARWFLPPTVLGTHSAVPGILSERRDRPTRSPSFGVTSLVLESANVRTERF